MIALPEAENALKLALTSFVLALLVAGLLATPPGADLDRRLLGQAGALDRQVPGLDRFMRLGTEIGRPQVILFGLFLPAAYGGEVARATVRICFVSLAANQTAATALKWITNRPRPHGTQSRGDSSFPSGHAAAAVGAAWILAARHRRLAPWVWLVAVWISSSRVFLERHYPSDVLAGALLGVLFAALALRLGRQLGGGRGNSGV